MLEKTYNKIVRFLQTLQPAEVEKAINGLPLVVAEGVIFELNQAGEAHRYHAHAQRAYYFRLEGSVLTIWSWNEVLSYKEAGEIHSLIFKLSQRLDEKRANEVYSRATGRSVGEPHLTPPDEPKSGGQQGGGQDDGQ
jgi:hypothetical protein